MIHLLRERATPEQLEDMLATLETYVKVAVDVRRDVLAGGGILHADCGEVLLQDGSKAEIFGVQTGTLRNRWFVLPR